MAKDNTLVVTPIVHDSSDNDRLPFDGESVIIRHQHHSEPKVRWIEAQWVSAHLKMDEEADEDNLLGTLEGGFFRCVDGDTVDLEYVTHWVDPRDVDDVDNIDFELMFGHQYGYALPNETSN